METSRRAVESYWRSRMIDAATSDEDKVAPVYKLEEICELLRTSSSGIVKEVSEFVLKRLDHKSPVVKQKALRLIKYSVGKAGPEFRREMQRHSVAVKQLLHYKGQPDPLKGDALNKAVRETAQDALSAIFSTEDNKPAAVSEVSHRRMEGFGNTNYVMPPEEKKSFLSEVVGIGSASIKQGLTTLAQAHSHSFKKNDTGSGSYRGPTLQRSLTNELDQDRYQKMDYHGGQGSSRVSRNVTSGSWGQNSGVGDAEVINGDSTSSHTASKTREERFLETIVTSGGVRLQPTRDALEAFLVEASKMDPLALTHALESKLQSPHWQVRMRAVCVLEAVLRKKEDEHFAIIMASYFSEHIDILIRCSESPQGSLREKANRVLSLLGGGQSANVSEKSIKVEKTVIEMPDLIDTGANDLLGGDDPQESQNEHVAEKPIASSPLIDDIFGGGLRSDSLSTSEHKTDEDPFADVSFHTGEDKELGADLFAGMTVGESNDAASAHIPTTGGSDPFDIFGSSEPLHTKENLGNDVSNLLSGLSINGNGSTVNQNGSSTMVLPDSIVLYSTSKPGSQGLNDSLSSGLDSQNISINTNPMFPMGGVPHGMPPGMLYNQLYPGQHFNHGAMGGLLTQQQLMAAMANLQSLSTFNAQNVLAGSAGGPLGHSAIPDIFNANLPAQTSTVSMNSSKEETKAFDFISEHLASARDPKRVS